MDCTRYAKKCPYILHVLTYSMSLQITYSYIIYFLTYYILFSLKKGVMIKNIKDLNLL